MKTETTGDTKPQHGFTDAAIEQILQALDEKAATHPSELGRWNASETARALRLDVRLSKSQEAELYEVASKLW